MRLDHQKHKAEALTRNKSFKKKLKQLEKKKDGEIDNLFQELHDDAFDCIDCLECANCCATTGPLFTSKDIDRISSHLKLSPGDFTEKYLRIDEDQDYVLQQIPCPFLGDDNYCSIYDVRPKACREYPHTDMRKQKAKFKLTLKNAEICPAVFKILDEIKVQ